jgi:hypothetical protein
MAFLDSEREKHSISVREGRTTLWSYFAHCSAMCVLIALAVCNGPLLYDYTLIYKGSLDGTVLSCVIATIMHLFLWIVIWLFLTIKQVNELENFLMTHKFMLMTFFLINMILHFRIGVSNFE